MLKKVVQQKKANFFIDLNDTKNYTCWVLKEKNKDPFPILHSQESKNIFSYGAVGLYLQKMEKSQQNNPNSNRKYYNIRFNNLISDIFPFERNPEINFMYYNSENENLFGNNYYENKKIKSKEKKVEELRKKMIDDDIPEMILYKYKYDKKLFQELKNGSEDEPNFIYNILNENKKYKQETKKDVINCIQTLIYKHKNELYDIPYIIKECKSLFNNVFTEEEVTTILSLYDALYIQFKLKQKKIQKLHNQLIVTTNSLNQANFSYNNSAKNDLDLYLTLSYLGYSISLMNFISKKKFCDNLLDLNINLNSKKLLQTTLEDGCDKIISKFCLSSEDVAYNLKILLSNAQKKLKEPIKDCQLMDVCTKKIYDLMKKNKKYHPIYLLQKAINFYIISLSSNPYIANFIFSYFLKAASISTHPTEKGRILLNYSNPSFRVKNIKQRELSWFIDELKTNANHFSEIYLDIEKCEKEGLIKCDIKIDMTSQHIEELIKLLNSAVNGQREDAIEVSERNSENKSINISDSEDTEINKIKSDIKKNTLVRKIVIKNMILDKEFTQKYFINYIKKECHNIAERYLIQKISNKFSKEILNRKYFRDKMFEMEDGNKFYYSIFFINSTNFCYIAIDKNKKIKYKDILRTQVLSNNVNELKKEMSIHIPKCIILGINNIGAYKLINYFEESDSIIFSDYLSLLKIPKQYDMNFANEKEHYYSIAYDQFKYTMNPLEFFIENYNFKYEKNLILNLKLHYLQEQINDIPLLNYCLETQMRCCLNLNKFKYEKGKNTIDNYYSFMNGLGPLTSKLIDDYKNKTISELKNGTGDNILKNIYPFIHDTNNMIIEEENNYVYHYQVEEIFNIMINSFHAIKNKSIHNVFVNYVDEERKRVNCVMFYNGNILKCILPFNNIDDYIKDINTYFKNYKILLCKIINLRIERNGFLIELSNKISDLEYLENSEEKELSYSDDIREIKEEDKLIQIQNLKNLILSEYRNNSKYLNKLSEEENNFIRNTVLQEIKKDYVSNEDSGKFCFRPSFLGTNNLILTLNFCENLTLNYNISKEKEDNYLLENKEYENLNDIVNKFVNPLLKLINEFKQNKYFNPPSQMKSIFNKIFDNINNINSINNKNIPLNPINICFNEYSPNYGILLTFNKNDNIIFDFIEFSPDGFFFHNKLFDNISLIIEYYLENKDKQWYKDFICENIITDAHSKLEYIDLTYKDFSDKMLNELNWSSEQNNQNFEKEDYRSTIFLGKKREDLSFTGWENNDKNSKKKIIEDDYDSLDDNNNKNDFFWGNDGKDNDNNNINNSWDKNDNVINNRENKNNNESFNNNYNNQNQWNVNNYNDNNFGSGSSNFWNENNNKFNNNNNNRFNDCNNKSYNNNYLSNNKGNNNFNREENRNKNNRNNYKFNDNNNYANKNKYSSNPRNTFNNNRYYNNDNRYNNKKVNKPASNFSWPANNQLENNSDNQGESYYNDNNNNINNSNNVNDYWSNNPEPKENYGLSEDNSKINEINSFSQNELEWSNYSKNANKINNNSKYKYNNSSWNIKPQNSNNNNLYNNNNYKNNNNNNRIYNNNNDRYHHKDSFNENNKRNNWNQFHNNKNNKKFNNQRYENNKYNKKKNNLWANELNKNRNKDDIKDDKEQGAIDFEKINEFGGYNMNNKGNQVHNKDNSIDNDNW